MTAIATARTGKQAFAPIVATGICGSGKTYSLQRMAALAIRRGSLARFIVLDPNGEWPGEPCDGTPLIRYARTKSPTTTAQALADGHRLVIVSSTSDLEGPAPLAAEADELAAVAIEAGRTVLVLPEVHLAAPEGRPVPPKIRHLLHRYRHGRQAGLWCDTQHFRDLHKEILNAAVLVLVHATDSPRDLRTLSDWLSPAIVEPVTEATRRMAKGEAGWRVELLRGHRLPPYRLVR